MYGALPFRGRCAYCALSFSDRIEHRLSQSRSCRAYPEGMTNISTDSAAKESGFSDWLKQKNFGSHAISAFKTGLAAVICVWLGNLFGLEHSFWAAVSAIVVMAFDTTITFATCR